jgi:outer membrane protein TolC
MLAKAMNPTKTESAKATGFTRFLSILLAIIIFGLVAVATVRAGDRPMGDSISLDQCLVLARENSPELRIATSALEASRFDRKLASQVRLPQLRLSAGAGFAPISHDFGYDPAVSNGGELGARIVAEQTLYSGGQTGLQLKQAQTAVSQQSLARQQQDRDLVYAVQLAYIDLLATEEQRKLYFQSVERLTDYTNLVLDLNQSGQAKYADVLNAQVELAQVQIDSGRAEQAMASARLNLNRLLGLPDDTVLYASGSLDSLLLNASDTAIVIPGAMNVDNLDISAAQLDLKQSHLTLDIAQSQWKPTVSLSADAGIMTSRENLLLSPAERYRSVGYSIGLSLEMPLWDRGKRKTETARSRTEIRSAEDNIPRVHRDVSSDYHDTRLRLTTTQQRLMSIRDVIQTAEKNYLLNTAQYADGYASASDVLLAQQALTDTHRSEIEALVEIQSLKARLDMITRPEQEGSL